MHYSSFNTHIHTYIHAHTYTHAHMGEQTLAGKSTLNRRPGDGHINKRIGIRTYIWSCSHILVHASRPHTLTKASWKICQFQTLDFLSSIHSIFELYPSINVCMFSRMPIYNNIRMFIYILYTYIHACAHTNIYTHSYNLLPSWLGL